MAIYVPFGSNRVSTTLSKNTTSDVMTVRSGGTATKTTVNPGCSIIIDKGGSAVTTVVKSGGSMRISGTADSTTLSAGAVMILSAAASAGAVDLKSGGTVTVSGGALLRDAFLSGAVELKSGAVLSHAAVNGPGDVWASAGAFATNMNINKGGVMNLQGSAAAVNIYGFMSVYTGGYAADMKVGSGGSVRVDGSASGAVVSAYGRLRLTGNGSASDTTVRGAGTLAVDGGVARGTLLQRGAVMNIDSDGSAVSTTISSGASLQVLSGEVSETMISSGGTMTLSAGCSALGTTVSGGSMRVWGSAKGVSLGTGGRVAVFSGGTARNNEVAAGGELHVCESGLATVTTLAGSMTVSTGGTAKYTTVTSDGKLSVAGSATIVNVENGGMLEVLSGGACQTAQVYVSGGGSAVFSGGQGRDLFVSNGGSVKVQANGWLWKPTVFAGGEVVLSGYACSMESATIMGNVTVGSGGTVRNASLTPSGVLTISAGGRLKGRLLTSAGATVAVESGGVVNFDLAGQTTAGGFLIDNFDLISGAPTFTITVKDDQSHGTYQLAEHASAFTGTISIGDGTVTYGQLAVNGDAVVRGACSYRLQKTAENDLTLLVSEADIAAPPPVALSFIDASDDWTDLKFNGGGGDVKYLDKPLAAPGFVTNNWVGAEDPVDYLGFALGSGAGLSFHVEASDAVKFTVYALNYNSKTGTFSLKSLQAAALKLDKKLGKYAIDTGKLLLTQGTYYIGVESPNAKKGGSADYTVSVNGSSEFFTKADNSDDWSDLRENGLLSYQRGPNVTLVSDGELIGGNWVGFGDEVDYMEISLINAARLSFHVKASDAVKFTVYTLNYNFGNHTSSLKSVQTGTAKLDKASGKYILDTAGLLLTPGGYYLGVNSTNAKRGGSADYSVSVNGSSVFFTKGDIGDDWSDVAVYGDNGLVNRTRIGEIASPGILVDDGWVGYGDEVDYMKVTLNSAAKLSFRVEATDAAKFTVYALDQNAKTGKYSLKSLQSVALKLDKTSGKYILDTAGLLLTGDRPYYIGMNSTNAKRGGSADYSIAVNGSSEFFTKGDNSDDWTDLQTQGEYSALVDGFSLLGFNAFTTVSNRYVGFGDEVDYMRFDLQHGAKLSFAVNATDAAKFTVYALERNAKTGKYSLKSLQSTALKWDNSWHTYSVNTADLWLGPGTYYIGVSGTNAKKGGSADYDFSVGGSSVFFDSGMNYDDWEMLADMGDSGLFRSLGTLSSASWQTPLVASDWVGYGDEVDYMGFALDTGAGLSFHVEASDAVKFTVYTLEQNTKTGKFSLKSLQSGALKLDKTLGKYVLDTGKLLLTQGSYYIGVNVVNAKKEAGADYSIALKDSSTFFPAANNSNDTWQDARDLQAAQSKGADCEGWVGYGDAADYFKLEASYGKLYFGLDDITRDACERRELKLTCLNDKGQAVAATLEGATFSTVREVADGIYYLGVSCTNVKKYDTSYRIMYLA